MDSTERHLALAEEKHALRGVMRRRLAALDPAARVSHSHRLLERLASLPAWRNARRVALFAPTAAEPDLDLLWHQGHLSGKECAYPLVRGRELILQRVAALETLRPVPPWNLREPAADDDAVWPPGRPDLILVPGLAFDRPGGRLGRGGGFYDRLLSGRGPGHPLAIGVGFEFQEVESLPLASHDARLDAVVLG